MSISWDENQMPSLVDYVESSFPLENGGELSVISMEEIPPNCFAGEVYIDQKQFHVFTNLENTSADTTVNIVLGYIVTMAFDKCGWGSVVEAGALFDCHRKVCEVLLDFNEDFCKHIEECADILEAWHQNHTTPEAVEATMMVSKGIIEEDDDDFVSEMGMELFADPKKGKGKEYVN